jgi:hypothetical protein
MIYRRVNPKKLDAVRGDLDITVTQALPRIEETVRPNATTDIERRDRALMAFTILTGARDGAIASFKLRHIDVVEGKIDQDARDVQTKYSKSFVTMFFPVGDDIRVVVADWVAYLRTEKLWGLDDPLFPKTKVAVGDDFRFGAAGLSREH